MESFTNFDTFTWEFVIENYKKKGLDLDGANVAAHQRGTTTGERWTEEEDDALAAAVCCSAIALQAVADGELRRFRRAAYGTNSICLSSIPRELLDARSRF